MESSELPVTVHPGAGLRKLDRVRVDNVLQGGEGLLCIPKCFVRAFLSFTFKVQRLYSSVSIVFQGCVFVPNVWVGHDSLTCRSCSTSWGPPSLNLSPPPRPSIEARSREKAPDTGLQGGGGLVRDLGGI